MAVLTTNLKKAVPAPHLKKLSAGDVNDLIVDDEEKSPPTKKPKLDCERNYNERRTYRHGNQPCPTVIESKASKLSIHFGSKKTARITFKLFTVPAGTTG